MEYNGKPTMMQIGGHFILSIMNWAYGAMPLNNGNVGTIYYTAA
jgi:hypothetical protein